MNWKERAKLSINRKLASDGRKRHSFQSLPSEQPTGTVAPIAHSGWVELDSLFDFTPT